VKSLEASLGVTDSSRPDKSAGGPPWQRDSTANPIPLAKFRHTHVKFIRNRCDGVGAANAVANQLARSRVRVRCRDDQFLTLFERSPALQLVGPGNLRREDMIPLGNT